MNNRRKIAQYCVSNYLFTRVCQLIMLTFFIPTVSVADLDVSQNLRIEAENYDRYHDSDEGNNGNNYRKDNVDIQTTSDEGGGFNVGWTVQGEWLAYDNLIIPSSGDYIVSVRVASALGGGLSVDLNAGSIALGQFDIPNTGDWQRWITVSKKVHIEAGTYSLGVWAVTGGWNLNWIEVKPVTTISNTVFQAEDYTTYSDTSSGNFGGEHRFDDVDIQKTNDTGGGYNVGWTESGEWLSYNDLHIPTTGKYTVSARVASPGGGTLSVDLNAGNIALGRFDIPATGGWQNWVTISKTVQINEGNYNLGIWANTGGWNLNWIQVKSNTNDNTDPIVSNPGGELGDITPLFDENTTIEDPIQFDRGDALVTRFSDRARDRHAKENHFQAYDHYLSFYWEERTAAIEIVDYVAKGGSSIRMNVKTLSKLDDREAENRWWYVGQNTLAEFCGNGVMNMDSHTSYWKEESWNCRENRPIRIGDKLEFEVSQFLDKDFLDRGRSNYYGTTFLYIVGEGIVPWSVTDKEVFRAGNTFQRDSIAIPEEARLGGDTTLHVQMTAEPDGHFTQMATNLGYENGQPFVLGRRLVHTSFLNGLHDENAENGVFNEMVGKAGKHYVNDRCSSCHERNGGSAPAPEGEALDSWVFKVGDKNGNADPLIGRVLQPNNTGNTEGEGSVSIAYWTEDNGLRSPNYQFSKGAPAKFSARIAPRLVGLGLLEAIPEASILSQEDASDANGDGISGRASRTIDPENGATRLGRFGWKASTSSIKHQIAAALNTDMGVMTSLLPNPDCGTNQNDCGGSGSELADEHLDNLVKYVSLLGVRPQRDYDNSNISKQSYTTSCAL